MMNGNGQAKGKEPVERVVDLFVHMPIGFAVMAWKRVPDLVVSVPGLVNEAVSKGCAQIAQAEERLSEEVRKARMIGQVAVTFGGRQLRREVDARLRDARQTARGSNGATAAGPVSATATPAEPASPAPTATKATKATTATKATKAGPARTTRPAAKKATKATRSSGAAKAAPAPPTPATAADLPIREYDGLSASQVVSRLTGLTPDELRAVRIYEDASRARRTVLLAIERLLAGAEEAGAGQAP